MHRFHHRGRFAHHEDGGRGRHFGRGSGGRHRDDFLGRDAEGEGRGRRGRFFDQGDLRLVLLQLSAEKPRYGYEFIKAIEERVGGVYSPSPGVVYPTLTLLEELGQVAIQQEDGKKLYAATEEGRAHLEANKVMVETIFARIDEAGEASRGGPPPQVVRAVQNLRMALRMKLARGPLDEEKARAIAAELDAVVARIEQI